MLTGEKTELPLLLAVTSNNESAVDLDINAANCGRVDFSLEGVRVYDSFGLTCVKRDIRAEGFCLVLPDFFEPEIVIGAASGADKEGAEYSVDKPGYDLSEPLWVREYAEGDSPKAIHWKLSGKLDKLMVREPGLPIEKSFLLLLETGAAAEDLPEPAMRSAAAEVFIALSQGLLAAGLAHTIAWQDRNNESFVRYMVAAEGELSGVLPKILAAGCGADEDGCLAHYVRNFDGVEQSHIVVVSAGGSFGDDGCAPSSVVTRLVGQSPENLHTVVV
jgi:hypothetical protein